MRTSYGVPHVTAEDWGSLGYGYGYAFAQDNFCVVMKEVLYASGQSAEFLGEAGDLESDFVYQWVNGDEATLRSEWIDAQDQKLQDLIIGYARGLSRYFEETGVDQLAEGPEGCRSAAWARPINEIDLVRVYRKFMLQAGIDNGILKRGITDVLGPDMSLALNAAQPTPQVASRKVHHWSASTGDGLFEGYIDPASQGSNLLALGGDYTQSGRVMVLGNPHQPWQGTGLFNEVHLTIPGD